MLGEKCIDFHKNRIKCFANMQRTRIKVFGEKRLKKGFAIGNREPIDSRKLVTSKCVGKPGTII